MMKRRILTLCLLLAVFITALVFWPTPYHSVTAQMVSMGGGGSSSATSLNFGGTPLPMGTPAPTNGQFLQVSGGTVVGASGTGTTSPGGASGAIQYNNGGSTFGGTVLTGIIKANGAAAPTAAVSGTDYAPATTGAANLPLLTNGLGGFATGTLSGNTTKFATMSGNIATGHVAGADANDNLVDLGIFPTPALPTNSIQTNAGGGAFGSISGTGLLKMNGASPPTVAVSNTDFQAPLGSSTAPANQFATGFTAPGTFNYAQPSCGNLSGAAAHCGTAANELTSGQVAPAQGGAGGLTGMLKAAAGVVAAAVPNADFLPATSGSAIQKASAGGLVPAVAGTDYQAPIATSTPSVAGQFINGFTAPGTFTYGTPSGTGGGALPAAPMFSMQYYANSTTFGGLGGTGIPKLNSTGSAPTIAVPNTDYLPATTGSALQKASAGGLVPAVPNTDYQPSQTIVIPAACDGTTNDQAIIQSTINAAPVGSQVALPKATGHNCIINPGITINTNVGFDFNGSCLFSPGLTTSGSAAFTISSATNGANFNGNRTAYRRVCLIGPGSASDPGWGTYNGGTWGLLIKGSNFSIEGLNIQSYNEGITFGNYAYGVVLAWPQLISNQANILYPNTALTDAGENIGIFGGAIANGTVGLENDGGEFNIIGTSFDYNTNQVVTNAGVTHIGYAHVEAPGTGTVPFQINNTGQNNYNHLSLDHIELLATSSAATHAIITNNDTSGMYADLEHFFISGYSNATTPLSNWCSGAGCASYVNMCQMTDQWGTTTNNNLGPFGACQAVDASVSFSDNTTGNVSTAAHGYAPKSPGSATVYLDGTGHYTTPAGTGTPAPTPIRVAASIANKPTLGQIYPTTLADTGNFPLNFQAGGGDPASRVGPCIINPSEPDAYQILCTSSSAQTTMGGVVIQPSGAYQFFSGNVPYVAGFTNSLPGANGGDIGVPVTTANNHLLILGATTVAPCITMTGWTSIVNYNGFDGDFNCLYDRIASGEPASYTYSSTGSYPSLTMLDIVGAPTTLGSVLDGAPVNTTGNNTTPVISALPATGVLSSSQDLQIGFLLSYNQTTTFTPPTGMVQLVNNNFLLGTSAGNWVSFLNLTANTAAANSTGSYSAATFWQSSSLAIKPIATGGSPVCATGNRVDIVAPTTVVSGICPITLAGHGS